MAGEVTCSDCAGPITRQSKTGRCRLCALEIARHDPEREAKRIARLRLKMGEASYRRNVSASLKRANRERAEDSDYIAFKKEQGRRLFATGLGHKAQAKGSDVCRRRGQKLSDQRLSWCPREYRSFYQTTRRTKGKRAPEAKRITLEKIAEDKAKMTPFERQLMRVRNGAGIVEVRPIPSRQYDYTLGGGSPL